MSVLKIGHRLALVRCKGSYPGPDRELFQEIYRNHHTLSKLEAEIREW